MVRGTSESRYYSDGDVNYLFCCFLVRSEGWAMSNEQWAEEKCVQWQPDWRITTGSINKMGKMGAPSISVQGPIPHFIFDVNMLTHAYFHILVPILINANGFA